MPEGAICMRQASMVQSNKPYTIAKFLVASRRCMKQNTAKSVGAYHNTAGALLFIAGVAIIPGIITYEALYPGYSTSQDMISNLGTTPLQDSIILPICNHFQLNAHSGFYRIISSCLIHRAFGAASVTATLVLSGIGVLGVEVFPR